MTLYMAFTHTFEDFDPNHHSHEKHAVLAFKLSHKEGEVAKLTLQMALKNLPKAPWVMMSFKKDMHTKLLFRGIAKGMPKSLDHGLVEVSYYAITPHVFKKIEALAEKLQKEGPFDPLFFDDHDPVNVLEARSEMFYFDRLSDGVITSNIFEGRQVIDLTPFVFEKSLKSRMPLCHTSHIKVRVRANWIQKGEGVFDLFPHVAKRFQRGHMNTFTPEALRSGWPREGSYVASAGKKSGYQVVESSLEPFTPASTGILNIYPTLSPPVKFLEEDTLKTTYLPRTWLKGRLVLAWHFEQKREETVHFTLSQTSQLTLERRKEITLHLGKLPVHATAAASFFTTKRGHEAIAYAMDVARAYLAASARCLEITMQFDWNDVTSLDVDSTVMIQDAGLGRVRGKVVGYTFSQNGTSRLGFVRILASVGTHQTVHAKDTSENQASHHGLRFVTPLDKPKDSLSFEGPLRAFDMIKDIHVQGDGDEQVYALQKGGQQGDKHPAEVLGEMPTCIQAQLLDLRTQGILHHPIPVKVLTTFAAPEQILPY